MCFYGECVRMSMILRLVGIDDIDGSVIPHRVLMICNIISQVTCSSGTVR
jgi:hypothetical protein